MQQRSLTSLKPICSNFLAAAPTISLALPSRSVSLQKGRRELSAGNYGRNTSLISPINREFTFFTVKLQPLHCH